MCSIIKLATIAFGETSSYWSAPKCFNFSAFHWSPHGCLITIGQHFVTTRVVHLPKRTETSLITVSDQSRANHQLLQLCTNRTTWSNQAVRAVHSCKSWFSVMYLFRMNYHKDWPSYGRCNLQPSIIVQTNCNLQDVVYKTTS